MSPRPYRGFSLAMTVESWFNLPNLLHPLVFKQLSLDKQDRVGPKPGLYGGEH